MNNLSIILGLVIAVAVNATLTRSAWEKHTTLQNQALQVAQQRESAQGKINQLPALRAQHTQDEQDLTTIQQEFPAEENLYDLVDRLQQAASASQVYISTISRSTQPSTIPGFSEVYLNVNTKSTYPQLYRLLQALNDEQRVLNVTAITTTTDKGSMSHALALTGYTRTPITAQQLQPTGARQ